MLNSGQQEFFFLAQIRDSFSKDFDFDLLWFVCHSGALQTWKHRKRCLYEALDLALNV